MRAYSTPALSPISTRFPVTACCSYSTASRQIHSDCPLTSGCQESMLLGRLTTTTEDAMTISTLDRQTMLDLLDQETEFERTVAWHVFEVIEERVNELSGRVPGDDRAAQFEAALIWLLRQSFALGQRPAAMADRPLTRRDVGID